MPPALEILLIFLRLGLTSFGGPAAHLGYFQQEFVQRRAWLTEQEYADIVALCQFLPGPASSQVGMCLGLARAGLLGALAAWVGFTLPSAALMLLFGLLVRSGVAFTLEHQAIWLHALLLVAVAVVAQAVSSMARSLLSDTPRQLLAVGAAILTLVWPTAALPPLVILAAGLYGARFLRGAATTSAKLRPLVSRLQSTICLLLFGGFLLGLPLLRSLWPSPEIALLDSFYRSGALVFGGGHVVLPLLEQETRTWVSHSDFLAGYGAAQAVPGPLFTLSSYLGAVARSGLHPVWSSAVALLGIFLPSFLLVVGAWPYWSRWRAHSQLQAALAGINAAVVGLLLAALYQPVWSSAVHTPLDFAAVLLAFTLLEALRWPAWRVLLLAGGAALLASFWK